MGCYLPVTYFYFPKAQKFQKGVWGQGCWGDLDVTDSLLDPRAERDESKIQSTNINTNGGNC